MNADCAQTDVARYLCQLGSKPLMHVKTTIFGEVLLVRHYGTFLVFPVVLMLNKAQDRSAGSEAVCGLAMDAAVSCSV